MRRLCCLVVAVTLCVGVLTACSSETSNESMTSYKITNLSLPPEMESCTAQCTLDGTIFVGGRGASKALLGRISIAQSTTDSWEMPANVSEIFAMCAADDDIAVLCSDSILRFSTDGRLLKTVQLNEKQSGKLPKSFLMLYRNNHYILLSTAQLTELDDRENEIASIKAENGEAFSSMYSAADSVLVSSRLPASSGSVVYKLSIDNFTFTDTLKLSTSQVVGLGETSDGSILVNDAFGTACRLDTDSGKTMKYFSWADMGIAGQNVMTITPVGSGFVFYERGEDAVMTARAADETDNRIVLTMATDTKQDRQLVALVNSFNKENPRYRIKMVEYGYHTEKTIDMLNAEILSGDAPDIFAFFSFTFDRAEDSGAFEDLSHYLDNDPEINRSDIVPSLLKAIERNGNLYWMPWSFEIDTYIAPKSVVGAKTCLTMDEATQYAATMGKDVSVFPKWMSKSDLLSWVIRYSCTAFVDKNSGICSFDSADFVKLLEACNKQRPDNSDFPEEYYGSLLTSAPIQNIEIITNFSAPPSDYNYVGFPVSGGSGSCFSFGMYMGIYARSPHKEGAWEFIRSALKEDNQRLATGFPVNEKVLENDLALALEGKLDTPTKSGIRLGKTDIAKLKTLIEGTTMLSSSNETIDRIIHDDAETYFAGEKTAEETAKLIQSQVTLFLEEQK